MEEWYCGTGCLVSLVLSILSVEALVRVRDAKPTSQIGQPQQWDVVNWGPQLYLAPFVTPFHFLCPCTVWLCDQSQTHINICPHTRVIYCRNESSGLILCGRCRVYGVHVCVSSPGVQLMWLYVWPCQSPPQVCLVSHWVLGSAMSTNHRKSNSHGPSRRCRGAAHASARLRYICMYVIASILDFSPFQ